MRRVTQRSKTVNSNLSDNYQIAAAVLNGLDAALGFAALQSKEHRVLSVITLLDGEEFMDHSWILYVAPLAYNVHERSM